MMFSLSRVLVVSLLAFAFIPAGVMAWLTARNNAQAVQDLAGRVLFNVAARVQTGTQTHLSQAHNVLNGLFPERLTPAQAEQARDWLRHGPAFEPMAFALSRQSPAVPNLYFGNSRGDYFAVENSGTATTVLFRNSSDVGMQAFLARRASEKTPTPALTRANFEPRNRAWYQGALTAKARVFSAVQVIPGKAELFITLSQPVYESDEAVAGVFGVDLYLQQLAGLLQAQSISANGAAFIVDEAGLLVAGSAGDALLQDVQGQQTRRSPPGSANLIIREGFAALKMGQSRKGEASAVASHAALQRVPLQGDTLLMVQRPIGESLGLRWTLVVAAPASDFTADIDRGWSISLGVMGVLLLLGAVAALYVASWVGDGFKGLSKAAQQLGRGEIPKIDRGTRLQEVRQLSQAMHDSAEQLKVYRAEALGKAKTAQETKEILEDRVARRNAQLLASREEALQAAKTKATFLATMSHEIRTPLNGVVGMSTLLAETRLDDEQRDYLQTLRQSSDQLLVVVNDILDFSKMESGKVDLQVQPLSLRGLIEDACDMAAPRARDKNLELIADIPDGDNRDPTNVPTAIAGDAERLRQVLIHLIGNAIKFTEKGEVSVSVRRLPQLGDPSLVRLEFRVIDSGIGIPRDRHGALFQAFTQLDTSTTRKFGGMGLGLAICKRLVELMGGEIGVESVLGKGSIFWFALTVPPAEASSVEAAVDASTLHGKRVLVVDDHVTNVRVLTRQLELWGMQVSSAEFGAAALKLLSQTQGKAALPDIIITDMHMAGMDGLSLAQAIKATQALANIPLVLLTSGLMPSAPEAAQLFEACLLKPARQRQLLDTLARCLAGEGPRKLTPQGRLTSSVVASKNITLLVVDDNPVNLKVACAMLARLGYQAETALDGREAVQAVTRAHGAGWRFGAVLMDVNMPRMNGLQATQQIQTMMGKKAPPVIALTAAASPEDRARCMAAGMDDYLTKPLRMAELVQALERWSPKMTSTSTPDGAGKLAKTDFARTQIIGAPAHVAAPASPNNPVVSGAEPALMDMERLAQFKEFDDEELSMTREVIGLFVADASQRLQAIERSIEGDDAIGLAWASHALIGATSNVGAVAMHAICSELETNAKTGAVPDNARQQLKRLQDYWVKTKAVLDSWR